MDRLYRERWLIEHYGLTTQADTVPASHRPPGVSELIDEFLDKIDDMNDDTDDTNDDEDDEE